MGIDRLAGGALAAAVLLASGLFSAVAVTGCGGGNAAGKVSTAIASGTASRPTATVTQSAQTVSQTQTLQQTVTAPAAPPPVTAAVVTTAAPASSGETTPTWVWVLVALGGAGLIALLVWLVRRGGSRELPVEERQRLVSAAVASWIGQGWAIESQTDGSAVLQRDGERVVVSVDAGGRVTSGPLGAQSVPR